MERCICWHFLGQFEICCSCQAYFHFNHHHIHQQSVRYLHEHWELSFLLLGRWRQTICTQWFHVEHVQMISSLWQKWLFVCNGQWWIQSERRKDKAARTIHFKRTRRGKTSRIWANGDRRAQQNFGKLTHTLEHLAQVTFRTNSSRGFAHRTCVMLPSQQIDTETYIVFP